MIAKEQVDDEQSRAHAYLADKFGHHNAHQYIGIGFKHRLIEHKQP